MSWDCPDCKFDNHEMRSKCRNCKRPRDDKSKEPKELGEKGMALSAWTCVFCAYPGNDDLYLNCACCQQTRADRILAPDEISRIHAHDRAMQEERGRAAKTRYCGITDEMVPVDQQSPLSKILRRAKEIEEDKRSIPHGHNITGVRPAKPVNARKIIEAIMDRMEQDQAFHKCVMIELAVLYGCEGDRPDGNT